MANANSISAANAELSSLVTAMLEETDSNARADLVSRITAAALRAAKDGVQKPKECVTAYEGFRPFNTDIYTLADGATHLDVRDQLHTKLVQLHAMLVTTYGEGSDSFHNYSEDIKDSYLWACADLAQECKALAAL